MSQVLDFKNKIFVTDPCGLLPRYHTILKGNDRNDTQEVKGKTTF